MLLETGLIEAQPDFVICYLVVDTNDIVEQIWDIIISQDNLIKEQHFATITTKIYMTKMGLG